MVRAALHQLRLLRTQSNLALSDSMDGNPQLLWYHIFLFSFVLPPHLHVYELKKKKKKKTRRPPWDLLPSATMDSTRREDYH